MKITCPYCKGLFNDTLEKCPNCGAPNAGVVRKSGGQPITIEELKAWYASKGLPPYETTRFFIGEDYKKPRAFGIYQDEKSGEFVVYKNKDSGARAVRYRGTDEAYAVNELYQRLKQEIIQQKRANIESRNNAWNQKRVPKRPSSCLLSAIIVGGLPLFFLLLGVISLFVQDLPKDGYYLYDKTLYYHYDHIQPDDHSDWFWYDAADGWSGPQKEAAVPEALRKNKQAKSHFLSKEFPPLRQEPAFLDSILYHDIESAYRSETGYYQYQDQTYYHLYDDIYSGWYSYDAEDGDWYEYSYEDIPYELQHNLTSEDFYYTPTWDSSTQITDFADTEIYQDYLDEQAKAAQSEKRDDYDDDDDYDYSWDSNDSWDSGSTDWDSDWD